MHTDTLESSAETAVSFLDRVRPQFKSLGVEDCLHGLPDDATEDDLIPRLIEMGPGIGGEWDLATMKKVVAVSQVLTSKTATSHLLGLIEQFAFSAEKTPLRHDALVALSPISPAARTVLDSEKSSAASVLGHEETRARVRECFQV